MGKRIIAFGLVIFILTALCACTAKDDVSVNGKVIAASSESEAFTVAESYEVSGAVVDGYASLSDAFYALQNGKADFVLTDELSAEEYREANENLSVFETCSYHTDYCVYFQKGSDLCEAFNGAIQTLEADETILKIKQTKGESVELPTGEKTLVMGVCPDYYPFAYLNDDGDVKGIDAAVSAALCRSLGCGLKIVPLDFDEMFVSLDNGEVDFILSAVTATEERLANYEVSDPYFALQYYLIQNQ